jgi:translation initiation factor IF-2
MLKNRQPIVTVLGHVDHGKTSLLDAIRQTTIVSKEAGGITQSIGASVVSGITFIDTPGHALFSSMRERGADIADIALLIIDGSSGIKPQTLEALELIQKNEVPFIVVITKSDLPSSTIENVLPPLEEKGIYFEGRGGQTPFIEVSAKNKINLDKLIDLILLFAEVNEIKGDEDLPLEAYVIETTKEKGGIYTSLVVKNGKLKIGDDLYTKNTKGRVRGLFDFQNKPVKEVSPGFPARVLGFDETPLVGCVVSDKPCDIEKPVNKKTFIRHDKTKIPLLIKANNQGALDVLKASIPNGFIVVDSGIGEVVESDVLNAKANEAYLFVFESKISSNIKKLADSEGVHVEKFDVIYELLEKLEKILKDDVFEIKGKAQILAEFPFDGKKIAGVRVTMGRIEKTLNLKILRGENEIGQAKAVSIKKQKQEVQGVSQGEECGILLNKELDFKIGDVIIAVNEK